jgi:hypothetical protein
VLDISDPSNPLDAGFFDTFPHNNNASFSGAWGTYPFLLSGLILISDINSGLYIVRDQTLTVSQGSFEFSATRYRADEGSLLTINVLRTNGSSGAVGVDYETQVGSADTGDFTLVSGRLEWADGESASKSFTIPILSDDLTNEVHESFFVRLLNPHGGATLSNPRQSITYINGLPTPGRISLLDTNITMANTAESVTVRLIRTGGFEGNSSVEIALNEEATTALNLSSNHLSWADGESGAKSVTLSLAPGTTRSNQVFTLSLVGDHLSSADPITTRVTLSASPLTSPPAPTPAPTSPLTTPSSGGKSGGGSTTWLLLGLLGCLIGRLRKTSATT